MGLIVPNDSRKPLMGCIDHKERNIVLFENGTIGYLETDEDSDLRGGSSYVSIVNELSDLNSSPIFSPSGLDWNSIKRNYFRSLIFIYGLILILMIVPFVFQRGTWNTMISDWTGVDFNGWARYILAFIACMLSWTPEMIGGALSEKRANQAILTLDGKLGKTEIVVSDGATPKQGLDTTTWKIRKGRGTFPLMSIVFSKVAFMTLIFIDFVSAVVLSIVTPFLVIGLFAYNSFRNKKALSDDEIEIPKVELSEIYGYILNRWGSSQLVNIISPGEGISMEFKSSLWYDYHKAVKSEDPKKAHRFQADYNPADKEAKNERAKSVIKAVAGFLNSDDSGSLLIGVDDDNKILGLERDFELLNVQPSSQRDEFEMQLDALLKKHLTTLAKKTGLWHFNWLEDDGKWVCMLKIKNSPQPVYHKVDGKEIYYRRTPSRTEPVPSGIELQKELEKFPR